MRALNEFMHQKEILKQLRHVCAKGETSLVVDFEKFLEFDMRLAKDLLDRPTEFFSEADTTLEQITKIPNMRLRVRGLDKTLKAPGSPLALDKLAPDDTIRAVYVGQFVQVEGTATHVDKPKLAKVGDDGLEEFEDYQEIRLDDFLAVVLRRDLVGKAGVGGHVVITGTLEAVRASEFYEPRLIANHLEGAER